MKERLCAFAGDLVIGELEWDRTRDRLAFRYDQNWRINKQAYPLSLSMPLAVFSHEHAQVESFLWGLLPDNPTILERWGRRFKVSPRHPFQMLMHVGEDCAGAVQFVRPERAEAWRSLIGNEAIKWLTNEDVNHRIQTLLKDHSASRLGSDTGHFSLAGAQPKTALRFDEATKRWGVPEGNEPSTHILKPATGHFDGFAENEHFCLRLAEELGFRVGKSHVEYFGGCPVIIVKRYDRVPDSRTGRILRVHQEDMCQALSIPPTRKYQSDKGPSPRDIAELLRDYSSRSGDDIRRFAEALGLNWILAGTDAHAKNFSIMIAPGGKVRLAPLYDIVSALPYPAIFTRKVKMAMKIGGKYPLREITGYHWTKLAKEFRVDPDILLNRLEGMSETIPETAAKLRDEMINSGLTHSVIPDLVQKLDSRCKECASALKLLTPPKKTSEPRAKNL